MFGMVLWFWGIVVITIGQQCCYFQLTKAFELVTVGWIRASKSGLAMPRRFERGGGGLLTP